MLLKYSVLCVLAAVTICPFASAQVPFPGACPPVTVKDPFLLNAYMGVWYEYAKYPFIFEIGKRCVFARYENLGNGTVTVLNGAINAFTGNPSDIRGTAEVVAPGELNVQFFNIGLSKGPNYLVLGTDYISYSVVYSCTNLTSLAHTEIVWILTRERMPSEATVAAAKKIIDENNLSQAFLMKTDQENCPDVIGSENSTGGAGEPAAVGSVDDPEAVAALNVENFHLEEPNAIDRA